MNATKQGLVTLVISIFVILNFALMPVSAQTTSESTPLDGNITWDSEFQESSTETYSFMADPNNITTLIIVEETMQQGIIANLVADDDLTTISSMNLNVGGTIFCIPPDTSEYTLYLQSVEGMGTGAYTALLTSEPNIVCDENLIDMVLAEIDTSSIEDLTSSSASTDDNNSANLNNENSSDDDAVVDVSVSSDNDDDNAVVDVSVSNDNDDSSVVDVNNNSNNNNNDDDAPIVDVNIGGGEGEDNALIDVNIGGEEVSCVATPNTSLSTVDIHILPTTAANVVTTISADELLNISGIIDDSSWVQVSLTDGRSGFVSANILSLASVCLNVTLPVVSVDQEEIIALEASANINTNDDVNVGINTVSDTASCVATPSTSLSTVDIHILPTTAASVVTTVSADELLNISGIIDDPSWVQVSLTNGRSGFVSANILSLASACLNVTLPVVSIDQEEIIALEANANINVGIDTASCVATPNTSASTINVRVLPTTAASVVTAVSADELLNISGTIDDASWMQVSLTDGRSGFVSASILSLASVCLDVTLPIVAVDQEEITALEVAASVNANNSVDVDVTVGGEDAPVVDVTVGGEDAPVVDVNVGGEDAPVVDVNVGGEDAPVVDVTVGGEDAPVVDVNVGGEDAPVVDVNVGGEDEPVVDVNVGGEDAPVVDVNVGGEDEPVVDVEIGLP